MFNGSAINQSPTCVGVAGADINNGPFTAVAFNNDGAIVACTDTTIPAGIMVAEMDDVIVAGDDVHFQIKDIGKIKAGTAIVAGQALSVDTNGCAVKATTGKFILGFALTSGAKDELIVIQITKSGYSA